jgi:hypothetical protein
LESLKTQLAKDTYFVMHNDLFYVTAVVPADEVVIVENCKTLEINYIFLDTLDDLDVREVNFARDGS